MRNKSTCVDEIALRWNPASQGWKTADFISSEVLHRRFHPNLFGFHPCVSMDFIFKPNPPLFIHFFIHFQSFKSEFSFSLLIPRKPCISRLFYFFHVLSIFTFSGNFTALSITFAVLLVFYNKKGLINLLIYLLDNERFICYNIFMI